MAGTTGLEPATSAVTEHFKSRLQSTQNNQPQQKPSLEPCNIRTVLARFGCRSRTEHGHGTAREAASRKGGIGEAGLCFTEALSRSNSRGISDLAGSVRELSALFEAA